MNFKVINSITKTNMYIERLLINYPNKERVLVDNIEQTIYSLVKDMNSYNVNYKPTIKEKYLLEAIVNTSMLDYYMLVSYNKKIIKKKQYESVSRFIEEIRMMEYGLAKSDREKDKDRL